MCCRWRFNEGVLTLAMEDPADKEALDIVARHTGKDVRPVQAHEARLAYCIDTLYQTVKGEGRRVG